MSSRARSSSLPANRRRSTTRSANAIISPSSRRTPDGRIPIVRQYRPALEAFTWELPAGLVEHGEDPAAACARELLEETGYPARAVHSLGPPAAACTGRLSNRIHSFFVETGERVADFTPEPGIEVALKSPAELVAMIKAGEFVQQLHLGTLMLAELQNLPEAAALTDPVPAFGGSGQTPVSRALPRRVCP